MLPINWWTGDWGESGVSDDKEEEIEAHAG